MKQVVKTETFQLAHDAIVELYEVNMALYGLGIYRMVPDRLSAQNVFFGSAFGAGFQQYNPVACKAEGFDRSAKAPPTPRFTIRLFPTLVYWLAACDDMRGCQFSRIRTFGRHLQGGSLPDASAFLSLDVFYVERKVKQSPITVEWELSSLSDFEGLTLPSRRMTKDYCPWLYRNYNGSYFEYGETKEVTVAAALAIDSSVCPYAGASYFDEYGIGTVDPTKDRCGKTLEDCKRRFGSGAVLPFGGFPGMLRL